MSIEAAPAGAGITLRIVDNEAPWRWLAQGWSDFRRAPAVGLFQGGLVALFGLAALLALWRLEAAALILPLGAGFMLVGPMLAVGLYETSRRLEMDEPLDIGRLLFVRTRRPSQLLLLGVALMGVLMIWARIASLLFALFFGVSTYPPLTEWIGLLIFSLDGLAFLCVGTVTGAVLAGIVFVISAISPPLLMVREVDVVTAIITSIAVVRRNPRAMLLWAWLIVLLTGFGLATCFVGLLVAFPLIGHGTWHAYRDLVAEEE